MDDRTHPVLPGRQASRRSILCAGAGLVAAAAGGGAFLLQGRPAFAQKSKDNVVIQWNNAALDAIRVTSPGRTIASRALAIMHTAIYDAWAAYEPAAVSTRPNGIPKRSGGSGLGGKKHSISYAAYRALLDIFPSQSSSFISLMKSLGEDPNNNSTDTQSHEGIGNVAAQAVLSYRHLDGANQLNGYKDTTGYSSVNTWDKLNDPRHWQPLNVNGNVQKFTTPQWGSVVPFALTSGSQFRPSEPIMDLNSSAFRIS